MGFMFKRQIESFILKKNNHCLKDKPFKKCLIKLDIW